MKNIFHIYNHFQFFLAIISRHTPIFTAFFYLILDKQDFLKITYYSIFENINKSIIHRLNNTRVFYIKKEK